MRDPPAFRDDVTDGRLWLRDRTEAGSATAMRVRCPGEDDGILAFHDGGPQVPRSGPRGRAV